MEFKECVTTKNKRCLIFYDYKYCLKRQNGNSIYWSCRVDKCSASISTSGSVVIKINGKKAETASHDIIKNSHAEVDHKLFSEEMVTVTNAVADMKLKVKNGETVKKVYTQSQNKFLKDTNDPELTAQRFPNLISIKTSLYNEQRKVYPKLPNSLDDLNLSGQFTKTVLDGRYLVKDVKVGVDRIAVFASDVGIEILCKSKRDHADGTFDITPPLFKQVYLIHGWYRGKMFPCVIILLTGKSFELYKMAIQIIKDQALENGLQWAPKSVMLDFEQASIKAFKHHFPETRMIGCFFHYSQCLWRKFCEVEN